jgi:hypothetical protein
MKIKIMVYVMVISAFYGMFSLRAMHEGPLVVGAEGTGSRPLTEGRISRARTAADIAQKNLEERLTHELQSSNEIAREKEVARLRRMQENSSNVGLPTGKSSLPDEGVLSSSFHSSSPLPDSAQGTRVSSPETVEDLIDITPAERKALTEKQQPSFSSESKPKTTSPSPKKLKAMELNSLAYIKKNTINHFAEIKAEIAQQLETAKEDVDDENPETIATVGNIEKLQEEVKAQEIARMNEITLLETEIRTNARPSALLEASLKELHFRPLLFSVPAEGEKPHMTSRLPVTITYSVSRDNHQQGPVLFIRAERVILPPRK